MTHQPSASLETEPYLHRWGLVPDGAPFSTPSSHLVPVRYQGAPAMLKVARIAEERDGGRLMVWWAGRGAARVLLHDDAGIVLERALGPRSLTAWANAGPTDRDHSDDQATRVLCEIAQQLHAVAGDPPPPGLVTLDRWFRDLLTGAAGHDGFLGRAAATARELLAEQRDVVVLHGDLHHGNVLDFGDAITARWRAIDPKFLVGDRAFDYTNIVCNPSHVIATTPGRLDRQVSVISDAAGLDRRRLLRWIVAWTGLSATWYLGDDLGEGSPEDPDSAEDQRGDQRDRGGHQGDPGDDPGDRQVPTAAGEAAAAAVLAVGQAAEALLHPGR